MIETAFWFLSGIVAAGIGGVIRGDFLGRRAAIEVESRLNNRIDHTLGEINRRLERLEDSYLGYNQRVR